MRAIDFWAIEFAKGGRPQYDSAVADAYKAGFQHGKDQSALLIAELAPSGKQLTILIHAIGMAEVDPVTGERKLFD